MADIFSKTDRSSIMRSVKSKGNRSTELKLIHIFKLIRLKGWRRNFNLIGKPDFVFPQLRIAIFADGCFWHGHKCRNTSPRVNSKYWSTKIHKNQVRDRTVTKQLKKSGWRVIRIWECRIDLSHVSKLFRTPPTSV